MDVPTVLFIDCTTPKPYDPVLQGIGGTEQTVTCLAEGLAKTGLKVVVEQHNRSADYAGKAFYTGLGNCKAARWVVVLRDPRFMLDARERFPNAKVLLYSHDLADRTLGLCFGRGVFKDSGCAANVCVSQWHRAQTIEVLKPFGYTGQFKIKAIYNPLSDGVERTGEPYDKNKLIWLASPHKGLARTYEIFEFLLKLNPAFRFYIFNPGYIEDLKPDANIEKAVITHTALPHRDVIEHLKRSLCLFYPNTAFPETFGKILAEANAVGTPAITHAIGAAREILDTHPAQIVNCYDTEAVIKRVMSWHAGERPIVRGNPKFKLASVVKEWVNLLNDC